MNTPSEPSTGVPASQTRRAQVMAWVGVALYPLVLAFPQTGGTRPNGAVHTIAAVLAACLLIGLFRRMPLLALSILLAGSVIGIAALAEPQGQSALLSFVAVDIGVGFIVATRSARVSLPAAVLSLAIQLAAVFVSPSGPDLAATSEAIVLAMASACLVSVLIRERGKHAVALRAQAVAEAVTAERLRIAREMHDQVAHSMGIVALQAGAAKRVIETQPSQAREALSEIEAASRETLSGLRRMLGALRKAELEGQAEAAPPGPVPGLADVDRLAATTTAAGVRVDVRWQGDRRPLPPDIDVSAYRIVQEAITNVVRHAGTHACRVRIDCRERELAIEVLDDGRGHGAASGSGYGLLGVRERVNLLHGDFSAGPHPQGGFRVAARLPLPSRGR